MSTLTETKPQGDNIRVNLPRNGARITLVLFVINALLTFANLYLSNGYVSKATYEADKKEENDRRDKLNGELRGIAVELKGISDHMLGDQRQDAAISDLEARMREQEKRK